MAYDERLAERVRRILTQQPGFVERKMFGGIAFMLRGHMCCGVLRDDLMVRVGPGAYQNALAQPHARPMEFTGRPMKGMVFVDPGGHTGQESLEAWVQRGVDFVTSLPPK